MTLAQSFGLDLERTLSVIQTAPRRPTASFKLNFANKVFQR
ncbi:MAG: hypothetical protein R3C97_05490 [Geminicoccaceae bacterium]